MSRYISTLAFVIVFMMATVACGSSGVVTPDPNFISTSVAQTLAVIQFQSLQPEIPITGLETPTPTISPSPTLSPTVTFTPSPVFTATPLVPQISVSVPTNCRVGPGKVYDRVGALLVGEVTQIYGRALSGNYWYVANPDVPGGFCWLWGEYASLVGNYQVLPIFTPPPTPTPVPAFLASYSGLESCNNNWWVEIRFENTGGITFKSLLLSVADAGTNTTVSLSENKFTNINGCNSSDTRNAFVPGEKMIVSSPVFGYDPTGHKLRATITLCSDINVNGTCVTQIVEFKP
ncbi:MAG TPA: hypothetical protein VLA72_16565 [Anaerolineales bacterium]|nr:hypothetical protein [Anaerolineales bacterium]